MYVVSLHTESTDSVMSGATLGLSMCSSFKATRCTKDSSALGSESGRDELTNESYSMVVETTTAEGAIIGMFCGQ